MATETASAWLRATATATARRLDGYHYESFHGFFFFLSSLFFLAFWYSVYRYYAKTNTDLTPTTTTTTRLTVVSNPAASTNGGFMKGPQSQLGISPPFAAYAVDDFGRKSMIPTAMAVEVPNPNKPSGNVIY